MQINSKSSKQLIMLIIGAKGFAKEVLEIITQSQEIKNIAFYDDVNRYDNKLLYQKFEILTNEDEVSLFFEKNNYEFTIGIGNPLLRHKLYKKITNLGGIFTKTISPFSNIGNYDVEIAEGVNVLPNAVISNSVKIGIGCILYYNVIVTHDCEVGDFVELSPNAILLGNVKIGDFSHIGANATILPNVVIGKNVVIGAGAVVNRNIPDNSIAVGIPAKVIKTK